MQNSVSGESSLNLRVARPNSNTAVSRPDVVHREKTTTTDVAQQSNTTGVTIPSADTLDLASADALDLKSAELSSPDALDLASPDALDLAGADGLELASAEEATSFRSLMQVIFFGRPGTAEALEENQRPKRRLRDENISQTHFSDNETEQRNASLYELTKNLTVTLQNLIEKRIYKRQFSREKNEPDSKHASTLARMNECFNDANETCLDSTSAETCPHSVEVLSSTLHLLLCVLRLHHHIEICNLISSLCKELSEKHVAGINVQLDRINLSTGTRKRNRFWRRKQNKKRKLQKSDREKVVREIVSRFYSKYERSFVFERNETGYRGNFELRESSEGQPSHYQWGDRTLSRGRRSVEEDSMVQILPRCLSQHQYILSASR